MSDSYYDTAQVCLNGHVINSTRAFPRSLWSTIRSVSSLRWWSCAGGLILDTRSRAHWFRAQL